MPRPGVTVELATNASASSPVLDSGQAFFTGVAERGPGRAVKVQSITEYEASFGARSGGSLLYDSVSAYFAEGGAVLYVSRISGATAVSATGTAAPFSATAASAGTWGNNIKVRYEQPSGLAGYLQVVVAYNNVDVERSPAYLATSPQSAVTWSQSSDYVRLVYTTGTWAALAAVSLTGGLSDNTVDATSIGAALDRFTYPLGPGQVAAPGLMTPAVQTALLAHVNTTRRVALLDAPDSPDPLVLAAAAATVRSDPAAKYAALFGPWATYPAAAAGVTVTVPYTAVQAGLLARLDAATQNPNLAAAGVNGIARGALALTQTYTDAQRETLNEAGVTVAVLKYGTIRTYGARSTAGPTDLTWQWFGGAREVMAIAHQADAVGENYVLQQIDGRGVLFASFNADLKGMLLEHYGRGALYGATPEEAFNVNTGAGVNTPETIANGEVHATIRVKTSPTAEWVHVVVVKTALDRPLAA